MKKYEEEFKKKIVRLHIDEARTLKSLTDEYGVSKAAISNWISTYREECQTNHELQSDYDHMKENRRLRKELDEMEKENRFLKKAAAFFAKGID